MTAARESVSGVDWKGESMTRDIRGIIPPLTTPFDADGGIYEEGLRSLVEFQIEKGSSGLFICGTYGSGPIMTVEERKRVHGIVVDQVKDRISVVAHVGTTSTAQSIELAQHAERVGAHCIASISPYYHRHDERTILEFFRTLAASVSLPVYVYNNPVTCGVSITPSFLRQLAGVGVDGIKDSGFSYIEFTHIALAMEDMPDFNLIIGTEAVALPAFLAGAKGCVAGLANAFPEIMAELWNLFQAGNYEEAASLQMKVTRARQIMHIAASANAACYAMLHVRGIDAGCPKAPIMPLEQDKVAEMVAEFEQIGLL